MNYDQARDYLLSRPEAWEDFPFGPGAAVYKIRDKLFAILMREQGLARVNLKCDPAEAQMLRDVFDAVQPGYHMNKRHWNTVLLDGSLPRGELERMMDRSYTLVVKGLRVPQRRALELAWGKDVLYR
ncbi:MAG: MmcQ/YjbR family DNA-binding protein [Oceanospirillaceae bacterium]|nr:MmcQ/YjbR family DNA-binding protein [Oceanospirillaceae bacterium]